MRSADVQAYLEGAGIATPIFRQGEIPDMPDEIVMLSIAPGLSPTYEQAFDRPVLRVQVRGAQNDPSGGEDVAAEVDAALMAPGPLVIGGLHVTNVQATAGPPALVGLDSDQTRRRILQATYVLEIARS